MGFKSEKQHTYGMHSCPNCDSILVQPVNCYAHADGHWHVELRCPECEWWCLDSYSQSEVDRYDEELNRGGQELIEDLRALLTHRILPEDIYGGLGLA